ncbi:MAG: hypothetical protein SynsKO_29480 [Synoicihabitans sp.]
MRFKDIDPMMLSGLRILAAFGLSGGLVYAKGGDLDLERQVPVPADTPIPVTDFFRPVYMSDPSINRAGSHVAALVTGGSEKPQLMVINLANGERDVVAGQGDRMVYAPRWLGSDHIAFKLSRDKRFDYGLMVARLKRLSRPYPIYQYGFTRVVGVPLKDPLKPLVWVRSAESQKSEGLYQLNAKMSSGAVLAAKADSRWDGAFWATVRETNQKHILKRFPEPKGVDSPSYGTDAAGELITAYSIEAGKFSMHLWNGKAWTLSPVDLDHVELLADGDRRGQMIAQPSGFDGEQSDVRFLDLETGEWGQALLGHGGYDFDGHFFRDPKSLKVVGAMFHRDGPGVQWFDEGYARLQQALDNAFPKRVARIANVDERGENLVVQVYSDRLPTEYYLVNFARKSVDLIAKSRPWIDPGRMRPMNIIQFNTEEGLKLDAYVTMPAGASKENPPPLIVMPHGGPWVRDYWGFNAEAQFWASRGYAVIQPNYRGSTGYNWKFPAADQFEFLKMHDDVTRAAKTLIRSGYADPDRVAIMGASFGGYLALSGVVHEPDMYKCAVSFAGVFDWEKVMQSKRYNFERGAYGYFLRYLGDPKEQAEKFERISPVRHVDQVKVPVFVAHGKDDQTALVGESKRLIAELKKHDVEHESWLINNEGHGTAELANRVELIARMEAFLDKHL